MREHCGRTFDEALLSGYVDGALTQAGEQRVRLHLEECAACQALVDQMRELKDVTRTSSFETPSDREWSEAPRTPGSGLARGVGWTLVVAWAVAVLGVIMYGIATKSENLFQLLVSFGGLSGFFLLLLGVLLDRLAVLKTDRYREVHR